MPKASEFAELFVVELNARHGDNKTEYGIESGSKYDRITITNYGSRSVHAFVEKKTGHVYKAAGWAQPAKGVRFTDVLVAAEASDRFGNYLYAK